MGGNGQGEEKGHDRDGGGIGGEGVGVSGLGEA